MLKRALCIMLTVLFCMAVPLMAFASQSSSAIYSDGDSGEAVLRIQLRLRELGYLSYPPTGVYRAMTVEAVKEFQTRCGTFGMPLAVDGRMGPESMKRLFDPNAPRVRIPDSVHMPRGPIASQLVAKGQLIAWSEIRSKLTEGREYTVTDCNTGEKFKLVFSGGENHAEMEPAASEDLEIFKILCGGEYNFLKRPVTVSIGGVEAAASMQCAPHGSQTVSSNGVEGHICVFFSGSLSHVANMPDAEHELMIRQAAGQ